MDMILNGNDFPDIISYLNNGNPTLRSPNSVYEISLMQTKETLNSLYILYKIYYVSTAQ